MIEKLKDWAKKLKNDVLAVYLSIRHKDTPLGAKILGAVVCAYAFSPIDLIPDFIPILGFLDDVILLPIGIYFVIKLIPDDVFKQCKIDAENMDKPKNYFMAVLIVLVWIVVMAIVLKKVFKV